MKRFLAIGAALALVLCGCSSSSKQSGALTIDVPEGAELIEGLMGYNGYVVDRMEEGSSWYELQYHVDIDGEDVLVGESFGYGDPQDYIVDLDGDGTTELVCNCTFGGDGALRVYAYKMVDGAVQVGVPNEVQFMIGYSGPVNAVAEEYLPEDECFYLGYPDGSGNTVDCYFSVDDLVWSPYVPSEG